MFRSWFKKHEKPAMPSGGSVLVRERGQQIRIGKDIIVSILGATHAGAMLTIQAPPHMPLGFPPAGGAQGS